MNQEPTRPVPLSDKHLQLISALVDETLRATGSKYAVLCVNLFEHIEESLKALEASKPVQAEQSTP